MDDHHNTRELVAEVALGVVQVREAASGAGQGLEVQGSDVALGLVPGSGEEMALALALEPDVVPAGSVQGQSVPPRQNDLMDGYSSCRHRGTRERRWFVLWPIR